MAAQGCDNKVDLYEVMERFSIMTVDGGLSDQQAFATIKKQYGAELALDALRRIK